MHLPETCGEIGTCLMCILSLSCPDLSQYLNGSKGITMMTTMMAEVATTLETMIMMRGVSAYYQLHLSFLVAKSIGQRVPILLWPSLYNVSVVRTQAQKHAYFTAQLLALCHFKIIGQKGIPILVFCTASVK